MSNHPVHFSLEVFPPKTDAGFQKLCGEGGTLEKLYTLHPDAISCTYGVGGTNAGRHMDVIEKLASDGVTVPISHYACIGRTAEEARAHMDHLLSIGVNHVLALRGDKPEGWSEDSPGMHYALDLVNLLQSEYADKLAVAVSGNPEGHVECVSLQSDIDVLKKKVDLGAAEIKTQLCWDLPQFERWLNLVRQKGITLPVTVGVMPVRTITALITQSLSRNGCAIDPKLCRLMTKYWINPNPYQPDDPELERKTEDFLKAGTEYTVQQIEEYRKMDIDGIHLFTLNKYDNVAEIARNANLTS